MAHLFDIISAKRFLYQLLTIIVVIFTITLVSATAQAQDEYPQPDNSYVNDYVGLLTAEDTANVKNLFAALKRDYGIEATVVTIGSVSDYSTGDTTIESFATNLFNTWGIGDKSRNDGVLLLVAVDDRKVRIEVGSGYGRSQDANMQEVINEHIIPSFKSGNFSRGIYRGARAIVGKLTGEWPADLSAPAPAPTRVSSAPPPRTSGSIERTYNSVVNDLADIHPATYIGGAVALVGVAGFGTRRYLRYRKRRCPHCQTYMVRLDEVSDDVYLDSGQKLEELLNSIDYDVWKCANCNTHTLHSYSNWFSGLKRCPRCSYRTVKVTSKTLSEPTYTSTGSKRVTKDCQNCDYRNTDIVVLPRRTRSSSSSSSFGSRSSGGSSFGGGRSSGGGASGSW